jgi:hypothetical protein
MTALERVARTQRMLGAAAITHALAWGLAATFGILALISFAGLVAPGIANSGPSHLWIAAFTGVLVVVALLWRSRHFVSRGRVALWIEERIPSLHYSLITALEHGSSPFAPGMETEIQRQDIGGVTFTALRKSLVPAVGALLVAALLLYISPSAAFGRAGLFPRLGSSSTGNALSAGSRLENIEAVVTPPAYTGQKPTTLDDPTTISGLTGSRITVRGSGSPSGITAAMPGSSVNVGATQGGWSASLVMPAKPAALTLKDRTYDRLIVLDPHADAPPKIVLTSPLRDTTLRAAQLVIHLDATATDDIGLNGAYFEYLITTGSGEIFNARTITTPVVTFGGSRNGTINATLDLASLKLNQGDVVSIRAIAQDRNTLTGPGTATSDTRTFRIARADEYDSVAVDAAAPLPVDTAAVSQRMLIIRTEKLVKEQKNLTRKELVRRSGEIGDLEDKIRKRVHEILFEGEDLFGQEKAGDPLPDIEDMEPPDDITEGKHPDLVIAYNALWAAVRSLQIAEPAPALPPMREALKALDRVRLANRLYLRGMPPKVVVDIARVRMSGKEKGSANIRTPRTRADSARTGLERRFNDAVELIAGKPADAVRAFTMLQVEALSVSPQAASALGEAIAAFKNGTDATLPLIRARRALSGEPTGASGLPAWSGAW